MAAPDALTDRYEAISYPGRPFAQTHPDRLATLAHLYGLQPAPPSRCRVLEVGCGDGGNLLPMAAALPESRFVGIDVAAGAIASASGRARELGIENVRFEQRSLADYEAEPGSVDYVIAHGVYSWIAQPLRDALLALCDRLLADQGVAYVSYNTLPGGRLREILSEILRSHVGGIGDPVAQLQAARELLAVLRTAWSYDEELATLVALASKMLQDHDALLFHDTLAPVNARVRFAEFAAQAARHGLQYLAEANFWEMQVGWLPDELRSGVLATDDRLVREGLLDQLRMRTFRQTLLCHVGHELDDPPRLERLATLAVSANAQASEPDEHGRVSFESANGANLTTDHELVIDALRRVVSAWPAIVPVAELWPADADPEERQVVCEALLRCYSAALAGLHAEPATFGTGDEPLPRTTPVARLQAREGMPIANLRHERADVDDPGRLLLTLLDGTRDRAALLAAVAEGLPETVDRAELERWIEYSLRAFAAAALLQPA